MSQDMYFDNITKHIVLNEYQHVISIGNKCCTTMLLRSINKYKESYPFDYVPTQPFLVLKYIKDDTDFLPEKGKIRNKDNVWLGHFDIAEGYDETVITFKRRFERMRDVLKSNNKFLLVYTTEADVYNEMNSSNNDNFLGLIELRDYIKAINVAADFNILAIHTNKVYEDTDNIINHTIYVDGKHLSQNEETHVPSTFKPYRETVKKCLRQILI